MGIRKTFGEIFGLEDDVEDERKRFVQRVNQIIFHPIDTEGCRGFAYEGLFQFVCFELGVDAHTFARRPFGLPFERESLPAEIRHLTRDDFTNTLQVLCALYRYIALDDDEDEGRKWLSELVEGTLYRCTCDIGVRWKDGFFYPSGAEELDKPLIEETLTWLKDYPDERKDYRTALQCYVAGDSLADVVKNCYSALEGVVRAILGNQKTLDNNRDKLLAKINLSDGWKRLLGDYIRYAHDYRHASSARHEITKQEAEAYLYMTGLVIRLTIESK